MLRQQPVPQSQNELFFYYSGHADDRSLLLQRAFLTTSILDDNRFQVRVAVIDACKSGSCSEKIGSFGPPMTSIGHSIPRPRSGPHHQALRKRRLSEMTSRLSLHHF